MAGYLVLTPKDGFTIDDILLSGNIMGATFWQNEGYTVYTDVDGYKYMHPHKAGKGYVTGGNPNAEEYIGVKIKLYAEPATAPDGTGYVYSWSNDPLYKDVWKSSWESLGLPDCWDEIVIPSEWIAEEV